MEITKTSKMTFKGHQRGDGMQITGEKHMPDTTEQSADAISLQRRPNMKTARLLICSRWNAAAAAAAAARAKASR